MYCRHWNLNEIPFRNTPDPRFLFYTDDHEEALVRLLYVVTESRGGMLLSGEYGSGKTLLTRVFLSELNENRFQVALVTNPNLTPLDFLKEVVYQLGEQPVSDAKVEVLHQIDRIIYDCMEKNKKVVILIDEAQQIKNRETFEEVRLLLNFQHNDTFLISLVLVGQPELRQRVHEIPQLKQRLGIKYHLRPLNEDKTSEYIDFRIRTAGGEKQIFTDEAKKEIFKATGGTPREINTICDMSLLLGYGQRLSEIDTGVIRQVVRHVDGDS